ncbi:hypothetical protein C8R48DRAFT_134266 [Suillus tomentosus]|nr:hypothetical protein C8R48DRAFT_134266 [Suillus tomentosus]
MPTVAHLLIARLSYVSLLIPTQTSDSYVFQVMHCMMQWALQQPQPYHTDFTASESASVRTFMACNRVAASRLPSLLTHLDRTPFGTALQIVPCICHANSRKP